MAYNRSIQEALTHHLAKATSMRTKVTLSLLAILLSAFGAVGALFSHLDASPFAQRRLSLPQKRSTGCQRDLNLLRRYTWVRHSHLSGSASGPWSASLRFNPKGKALYHKAPQKEHNALKEKGFHQEKRPFSVPKAAKKANYCSLETLL